MLIQIGSGKKEPSDIVDLLLECHERIRSFIGLASRLAGTGQPSHDEIRDAAKRVIRYFSEALPLHVADEEQTVLPRLSGRSLELDATLQDMHREHLEHEPQLQLLLQTCKTLEASPERLDDLRQTLLSAVSSLEASFITHLEQEERSILPAIRTLLTSEEQAVMLSELRSRRQ
jgi:iron-sulfur cluster repair protein YtfE (RIC family)